MTRTRGQRDLTRRISFSANAGNTDLGCDNTYASAAEDWRMETCSMNLVFGDGCSWPPSFQLLSSCPIYSPRVVQSVVVFLHSGLVRYSKKTKEIGTFASTVATNPEGVRR